MNKNIMRTALLSISVLATTSTVQAENLNGLWSGLVEVNQVNQLFHNTTDSTTVKDVKYPFNLQLLLHSDASGVTHLLREVFIMQTKTEANEKQRVLVTNEAKIGDYEGIIRRGDNKLVAVRLTSPSFDFGSDTKDTKEPKLLLTGRVSNTAGSKMEGDLTMAATHPLNPMKHQFHNQHKTGFDITRKFTITIKAKATGDKARPAEGKTFLNGTYEETITGVHKRALKVKGDIQLTRVSDLVILDPVSEAQ